MTAASLAADGALAAAVAFGGPAAACFLSAARNGLDFKLLLLLLCVWWPLPPPLVPPPLAAARSAARNGLDLSWLTVAPDELDEVGATAAGVAEAGADAAVAEGAAACALVAVAAVAPVAVLSGNRGARNPRVAGGGLAADMASRTEADATVDRSAAAVGCRATSGDVSSGRGTDARRGGTVGQSGVQSGAIEGWRPN